MAGDIFDQVASGPTAPSSPDIFDQVGDEQQTAAKTTATRQMQDLGRGGSFATDKGVYQPESLPPAPSVGPAPVRAPSPAQQALDRTTPPTSRFATPAQAAPTTYQEATSQAAAPPKPVLVPGQTPRIGGPRTAAQTADQTPVEEEPLGAAIGGAAPGTHQMTPAEAAEWEQQQSVRPTGLAAGPRQGVNLINRGTEDIAAGAGYSSDFTDPLAKPNPSQMARGGTEAMSGAMQLGTPAFAAGVAAAPVRAGLYYLAGVGAGKVAQEAAKAAGLSPDEQEFWNTVGFFLPNAATALAGVHGVDMQGSDGTRAKGFTAFGGRVGAGMATSPDAVGAGARVGPFSAQVVKPRGGGVEFATGAPPRLPDPGEILTGQQNAATMDALVKANALDQAAQNVVNGKPPVPPPPTPPMPDGMEQGILKPETLQRVAAAISTAPAATRPQLVAEAHGNLAKWIAQQGRVVGPDGKILLAKTPEQAQSIAAKIVNDEVGRQDTARNEAAKAQKEQEKQAAKAASTSGEKEEVTAPPTLQQRAQTIIEANEKQTPDQLAKTLVRQLGIPYAQGKGLVQEARAGKAPSIESGGQAVVPEQKAAIDQQMADLKAGKVKAIRIPAEAGYVPALPDGIKRVDVKNGDGSGTYLYQPGEVRAATIKAAAKAGTHEDLLAPKADVFDEAAERSGKTEEPEEKPAKYEYGNTQATIPEGSDANEALAEARSKIDPADLVGTDYGGDSKGLETDPHVTVRYGLKDADTAGLKSYLEQQAPFEATLGKTTSFPASKSSDGGAPIIAPVEAPQLRQIEAELDQHGNFIDRTFPEYKPHATLGYVKPEAAAKYEGMTETDGKRFKVESIEISHKDGTKEVVPLKGKPVEGENSLRPAEEGADGVATASEGAGTEAETPPAEQPGEPAPAVVAGEPEPAKSVVKTDESERKGGRGESPEPLASGALEKGARVTFTDRSGQEHAGTIAHADGRIARIKADDDKKSYSVAVGKVKAGAELSPEEATAKRRLDEMVGPGAKAEGEEGVAPGTVGEMATRKISLDPKRFQYKLHTDAAGVTNLLRGRRWNGDLAGVISVWRDPANGRTYVVNGHHRFELARENGVKTVTVRRLAVTTAADARALGALQNIAEGRGTPLDAAKFFRETGITPADLDKEGISLGEATAANGVALSRLSPQLFDDAVSGKIRLGRAVAIGNATDSPEQQEAILKLIQKQEAKGKRVSDDVVDEMVRLAKSAGEHTEHQETLFGLQEMKRNLALEKAEVSAYVRSQIGQEKRLFAGVSDENKAERLGRAGNKIDPARNAEIARQASQAQELYDRLSTKSGEIDDILSETASELANGQNPAAVKSSAYTRVRESLSEIIGGTEDGGIERVPLHAVRSASLAPPAPVAPLASRFARLPGEQPLPGFEEAVEQQKEAAAEHQSGELEQEMRSARGDISRKAGEIERNSPLFRDSGASGQEGLFSASTESEESGTKYLHGGIGMVIPTDVIRRAAGPVLRFLNVPEEYEKVRTSRDLQTSLYEIDQQANADVLRAKQLMESMPGTPADFEAIYHHIENPKGEPLNALQQRVLDEYIAPIMQDTADKVKLMREDGATIENYVHRVVKDRGSFIDRLLSGSKSTGKGNPLRKHVPSERNRTMMALESKVGNRVVVSVKGDRVTAFRPGQEPKDMGSLSGGMTTKLEQLDERLEPVVRDILKTQDEIEAVKQRDREDHISGLRERLDQMKRDRDLIAEVKGRTPGQQSSHGIEVSFNKRAALTRQIEKAEKELEAYERGDAQVQLSNRSKERVRRLEETLEVLRSQRGRLLEQVPTERMADRAWEDKSGKSWKLTQATTKEIEASTDLQYYHSAIGSAILNWLAVNKQYRALEFLKAFTENPDFALVGMKIDVGKQAPDGWRTTELPQLRSYYFEPHVAEVLDWYADRMKARQPGVFEKINDFLISSIFFNPLLHVPNILNHWAVEKGVSGWVDPRIKMDQARAAMKAINAVIHQNDDFLAALDAGAPIQSQQFGTHEYAKLFLEKLQGDIADHPDRWAKLAKALSYANPLKLLDAMKAFSGRVTWYSNDIAFLQSAYEKMERGMDLKVALRETGKHIPDYRMPTRIFDNAALAKALQNHNLVMFMHYHYGALRSYGETLKSLAGINWQEDGTNAKGEATADTGRTADDEKSHGLDILAMLGLVTLAVYPLIDKLLREMTGDQNATMRRAGASTLPYNLIQMAHGEKSPADALQSVITPGVTAKALTELAANVDLHTGRHIYTYPVENWETFGEQAGSRIAQSFGPGDQILRVGREGLKRQALGMVGVTFPQHGAMKIASEIAANDADRRALTPEESRNLQYRYQALDALHAGDEEKAHRLMAKAGLSRVQRRNLIRSAKRDPLLAKVEHFTVDEVKQVYDHATAEEKMKLGPLLRHKEMRARAQEHGARE